MTDHIEVTRNGAVQTIRMNRPDKKNAITRAMYAAMSDALRKGEADDTVRVHVILGVPGAFSAGNDLQDFMAVAAGGDMGREVLEFLDVISTLAKPLVSGVDGLAIGIGTTIHMHCDLTFATPQSLFRTPFIDLGLVPEAGSSMLAPMTMGHQRAYALLAMGEGFTARQAADAGLIWQVVDAEVLEQTVAETAARLAARAPGAMTHAKRLMKPDAETLKARIIEEATLFAAQLQSAEAREAFMAFMTRKK